MNSRSPHSSTDSRLSGGDGAGTDRPSAAGDLVQSAAERDVVHPFADRRQRVPHGALRQARVRLGHRLVGVREPVELEVIGCRDPVRRASRARRRGPRAARPRAGRTPGTHCSVTSTRMPRAPSPSATAGEQLGVLVLVDGQQLAVRSDQRRARDLGGDAAEPRAGAVRAGGDGAGDGLAVDVAEVRHRQAVRREQRAAPGAGACPRAASRGRARGRPRRDP